MFSACHHYRASDAPIHTLLARTFHGTRSAPNNPTDLRAPDRSKRPSQQPAEDSASNRTFGCILQVHREGAGEEVGSWGVQLALQRERVGGGEGDGRGKERPHDHWQGATVADEG